MEGTIVTPKYRRKTGNKPVNLRKSRKKTSAYALHRCQECHLGTPPKTTDFLTLPALASHNYWVHTKPLLDAEALKKGKKRNRDQRDTEAQVYDGHRQTKDRVDLFNNPLEEHFEVPGGFDFSEEDEEEKVDKVTEEKDEDDEEEEKVYEQDEEDIGEGYVENEEEIMFGGRGLLPINLEEEEEYKTRRQIEYLAWRKQYYRHHLYNGYFSLPPQYDYIKTEELALQREIIKPTFADVGFSELDLDLLKHKENGKLSSRVELNLYELFQKHFPNDPKVKEMLKPEVRNAFANESKDKGMSFTKCFPLRDTNMETMFKDAHIDMANLMDACISIEKEIDFRGKVVWILFF